MTVIIDPIWPWSYWLTFWASASGDVLAAVVLSGLMAFVLPILWQLRPRGVTPRQLVRFGGALLAMALGWVAIHTWSFTSAPAGRLHGLLMAALVVLPATLLGLTVATYLASPAATRRRTVAVLGLRLLAFLLAALAIVRPSLASPEHNPRSRCMAFATSSSCT